LSFIKREKTVENVKVGDLMIPLHEYAVVAEEAILGDMIRALKQAQARLGPKRQPPRAVLVIDRGGKVIGQLGYLDFLKALEPKYNLLGDLDILSQAGVSDELIDSIINDLQFFQGSVSEACRRSRKVKIKEIMRPLNESIDENASLSDAIHKFVMWQTPRILVTRQQEVAGILRLADLFATVIDCIDRLEE
jgi:predicted transcriptional regulator